MPGSVGFPNDDIDERIWGNQTLIDCAIVTPKSLRISEKDAKRFNRAMNILDLQPFVHPSQLFHSISPTRAARKSTPGDGSVPGLIKYASLSSANKKRWKDAISHAKGKLHVFYLNPILTSSQAWRKPIGLSLWISISSISRCENRRVIPSSSRTFSWTFHHCWGMWEG